MLGVIWDGTGFGTDGTIWGGEFLRRLLAPSDPVLTSESSGRNNHHVKPPDDSTRAAELKAMQDSIYREKILRARRQTPEERLADVFELSNSVMSRMLDGAMWQLELTDEQQGWDVVRQRLARLRRVNEAGLFTHELPTARP